MKKNPKAVKKTFRARSAKPQIQTTKPDYSQIPCYLTVSLMFILILISAGGDLRWEYSALILIFIIGIITFLRCDFNGNGQVFYLALPFIILSIYSFLQGSATLLTTGGNLPTGVLLPVSFDVAGSFRCGLKFAAFAVLLASVILNFRGRAEKLIWILVFTGNFFVSLGIIRYFLQRSAPEVFGYFIDPQLRPGIGFGTFLNQNHFAFFALMPLGLNAGLIFAGKLAALKKIALIIGALMCWTAIILTASRGGIISAIILFTALLVLTKQRFALSETLNRRQFLIGGVFFLVLLVGGFTLIFERNITNRFAEIPAQFEQLKEYEDFRRPDIWKAALAISFEHPFFGIGFGGFRYAVSRRADISGVNLPEQAHNDYLELLVCGGLAGLSAGLWAAFRFTRAFKTVWIQSENSLYDAAKKGAFAAVCGIAVHSLFDFGLQIIANWFFLTMLLGMVFAPFSRELNFNLRFFNKVRHLRIGFAAFCSICLLLSVWAALIRYEIYRLQKDNQVDSSIPENFRGFVVDADFFQSQSINDQREGNLENAVENIRLAIRLRPQDYKLYLRTASLYEQIQETEEAEKSYRSALELAPYYWETHYQIGKFLISTDRAGDGINQLATAARRNRTLSQELFELTWRETAGNSDEFTKILSPPNYYENVRLAHYLLEKREFRQVARVLCRDDDLDTQTRLDFVNMLAEKKQFIFAYQVYSNNCDSAALPATSFTDGDFEKSNLESKSVFGWRIGDLPETIQVGLNRGNEQENRQLEILFNGLAEPQSALISQTAIVQKRRRYRFSFSYLTKDIISGGLPVIELIYQRPDGESTREEIPLASDTGGKWAAESRFLNIADQIEAVEIRLARRSCKESPCPIFGKLELKNIEFKPVAF